MRRKFTPISPCGQTQHVDFLFKVYRVQAGRDHPHGGKITQRLAAMRPGDQIDVEGPSGKFAYHRGVVTLVSAL